MQSQRTASKIHARRRTTLILLAGIVGFSSTAHASEIDTLLFGSLDAGGDTFLTLGAKVGLTSLAQEGFVALATVGHQWFFDWGVVAAYAGLETTSEMLIAGPTRDALPTRFGLRLHGEVWARPTAATLLQATAVAGSARDSLWARLAWGYRLWETYLGPEAALYTDATGYAKWSLGLHGTDFALGRYSLRASVGLQTESRRARACPYVTLSVWSPL